MLIYTFNSLKDFILAYSPSLPFLFKLNYLAEYYALDLGSSYSLKASSLLFYYILLATDRRTRLTILFSS